MTVIGLTLSSGGNEARRFTRGLDLSWVLWTRVSISLLEFSDDFDAADYVFVERSQLFVGIQSS
jgi:hypothetical protein